MIGNLLSCNLKHLKAFYYCMKNSQIKVKPMYLLNLIFKSFKLLLLIFFTLTISLNKSYSEVYVYDSHNIFLGVLINTSLFQVDDIKIYVPDLNKSVYFRPVDDRYETLKPSNVHGAVKNFFYSSYNCSGQPYLQNKCILHNDVICDNDMYYGIDFLSIHPIIARSYRSPNSDVCRELNDNMIVNLPLESIELPFKAPVHLPLKFSYVNNQNTQIIDVNADGKTGVEEAIHCLQLISE